MKLDYLQRENIFSLVLYVMFFWRQNILKTYSQYQGCWIQDLLHQLLLTFFNRRFKSKIVNYHFLQFGTFCSGRQNVSCFVNASLPFLSIQSSSRFSLPECWNTSTAMVSTRYWTKKYEIFWPFHCFQCKTLFLIIPLNFRLNPPG